MNAQPDNSSPSPCDDPLDQLLNEARWPAPTPKQLSRSAEQWHAVWHAQRRRERFASRAVVVGFAASVLVAVIFGWRWFNRRGNDLRQPVTIEQPKERPTDEKNAPPVKQTEIPRIALRPATAVPRFEEPVLSRAPSKLEELLVGVPSHARHNRKRESQPHPSETNKAASRVASSSSSVRRRATTKAPAKEDIAKKDAATPAVARLVANPKLDVMKVAAGLRSAAAVNELHLLAILANAPLSKQTLAYQMAAIRLLAEIGSPRSVPDLLRASTDSNLHVASINALGRLADSAILDQLASQEPNRELQRSLLTALLGRGDLDSYRLYLSYLQNEATAETALAAAEQVPNPPMEILFAALGSPSELERLAAARVLGRIDGPATTARLVAMLEEGTSRQEACVALLSSRGPEAVSFVRNARTNPTLAALFDAASVHLWNTFASHDSQSRT
jgi:hypothetical protein